MKQIHAVLARLAIVCSSSLGIATIANYFDYSNYWNVTISRVQTVDFNILSHMAPTKLSYALIQQDRDELKRTLSSNFGLFGMVVTDCKITEKACPGQKILNASESDRLWKRQLSLEDLPNHPYDILRDPPPILTEKDFTNSHDITRKPTGKTNIGRAIGRVYYIRGIPPSFAEDYVNWILSPISLHGSQKDYGLTIAMWLNGGLFTWGIMEWLLYRRRVQKRQALERSEELQKNAYTLQQKLQTNEEIITTLLAEKEGEKLRWEQTLSAQNQQIEQSKNLLAQFQGQISSEQFKQLEQELVDANAQASMSKDQVQILEQRIEELRQEREEEQKSRERVEQQLEQVQKQQLQQSKEQQQSQELLEQIMGDIERQDLNAFERKVFSTLEGSSQRQQSQWKVLTQFDISKGNSLSQFTDFIVTANNTAIVIEAKNYSGRIQAEGDIKNTQWYVCQNGNDNNLTILSSWGKNPYQQLNRYTNSLLNRFDNRRSRNTARPRIFTYGIVVFPDKADISAIESGLSDFYRVIRLGQLVEIIEELSIKSVNKSDSTAGVVTSQQIENILLGRPIRY
jgi:Nuclease-related domain